MHDIQKLEGYVNELYALLGELGDEKKKEELLKIMHRPGWTTPIQYQFVEGLLEGLNAQVLSVQRYLQALHAGSLAIAEEGAEGRVSDSSPDPIPV